MSLLIDKSKTSIMNMQTLRAGSFELGYSNGFIRRIRYDNVEVLRMIYMALRDQNWNTYDPIIENEMINLEADGFAINYDCFHELNEKRIFKWQVAIAGNANSEITFEIFGESLADVLKNRAGLCILHPIKSTAGAPCEMYHTDGSSGKSNFPIMISADNPFKYLKAFRWKCENNWYLLEYEGDGFETEDQRNWSDASYKTFCTPLDLPFPVQLKAGDKVHQKVTFKPVGKQRASSDNNDNAMEIVVRNRRTKLPKIGIAASTEVDTLSDTVIDAIQKIKFNHYRIEVFPFDKNWVKKFEMDCGNAKKLNLPVEIALHVKKTAELNEFCETCKQLQPVVAHIILLSYDSAATKQSLVDEADFLKKNFPTTQIGAGTDYNYRELNVNRIKEHGLDFISYSIDPQEHATDDLTIIENISAQAETIQSARDIYGLEKPIHISSLTLKKRFNPAATVPSEKMLPNVLKADPRQLTNFAATFAVGSIKCLSQSNANSVTLFQTAGGQGIISASGQQFPVYNVLQEFLTDEFELIDTESNNPLTCDGVLLANKEHKKLILVNYSDESQWVTFQKREYLLEAYAAKIVKLSESILN